MFCGYCGKQANDGVKFCPYCGKPMQGESVVVIETEENITTSETTKDDKSEEARSAFIEFLKGLKKAKKLIIAAVVVLVVIIAGVSIVKSQNSVVGTWEYSYCNHYGQKTEEEGEAFTLGGSTVYKIILYSDGTFKAEGFPHHNSREKTGSYNIINDGKEILFYYKYSSNGVFGEKEVIKEFDRKGNELIFVYSNGNSIHYKKTK